MSWERQWNGFEIENLINNPFSSISVAPPTQYILEFTYDQLALNILDDGLGGDIEGQYRLSFHNNVFLRFGVHQLHVLFFVMVCEIRFL